MDKPKISADEFLNNDKRKKIYCTNCGKELLEEDNFCLNCGKNLKNNNKSNKKTKKIIIFSIVLIAIIAIVGGILLINQEDNFPVEVVAGGETFHLPEGYVLYDSIDDEYGVSNVYNSDNSGIMIGIQVYPLSMEEAIANIEKTGNIIYDYNASFGGYSGIRWGNSLVQTFTFERNGKTIDISISPLNENEFKEYEDYIPKIIE
ncbi:hypothetical protein SDC9_46165 [bioreactor metagenome]|uniref:Zinc-ribbon domain-containing protein n=1 Tax=bioreactor metagenome TaxID=1076179 RepID=A0A644WC27_9ZZZZ|nr:zinc ribbon domain-containing protein [Methanobrevibacter sp.]MEA4957827.1 zinc ribbon domain-containing protein [Methanobrevibacter sp.]